MLRNPQVGMRVRFTDISMPTYLGKAGTILSIDPSPYSDDETLINIQFDDEYPFGEAHGFFLRRLSDIDHKVEQRDRERMADQKRRQEHADKYL